MWNNVKKTTKKTVKKVAVTFLNQILKNIFKLERCKKKKKKSDMF